MEQTLHRSVLRRLQLKMDTLVQVTVRGDTDKINGTLIQPTNFSLCRIQTPKEEKLSQQMFKNTVTGRITGTVVNSNFPVFNPFTPSSTYLCHKYLLTEIPTNFWNPAHSCALILNEDLIYILQDWINQITPIPNHALSMVLKGVNVDNAFLNYVGCGIIKLVFAQAHRQREATLVLGLGVVAAGPHSCSTVENEVQPCLGLTTGACSDSFLHP